jgi:invasion associated locus B (IalB) protein
MKFPATCTLLTFLAAMLACGPARAQSTETLGEAGKWKAYTFLEDGNKVCYMSSAPDKSEGDYKVRGPVYALVTHRPAQPSRDVVSLIVGYPLKPDADVLVTIDRKQKFKLFSDKETAWAVDEKADRALVQAMVKGTSMVVEGVSSRGTKTRDIYSLSGFGKMYQAIGKACGIKG